MINAIISEFDKIIKFDDNTEIGEPLFIAKINPQTEDDGYLVTYAYNNLDDTSDCIILQANEDNKILARIKIGTRVPHGLHASWIYKKTTDGK